MNSFNIFFILAFSTSLIFAVPTIQSTPSPLNTISEDQNCNSAQGMPNLINCMASKALTAMNSLQDNQNLQIAPGITLTSTEPSNNRKEKQLKELKPEDLNSESSQSTPNFINLLFSSITRFLSNRSLKIELPKNSQNALARAFEESRGKMKKVMGPFMLSLGAKMMTMVPVVLSALALLVTKALVVGKLALVIAVTLAIQQFFSGRTFRIDPGFGVNQIPNFGISTSYGAPSTGYPYPSPVYGTNNIGGWGPFQRRSISEVSSSTEDSYSTVQ